MPKPTLQDVAELAGVHRATASRALNAATSSMISAETVRRVQRAADKLGYRPNSLARALKTSRSYTIGVVVPDLTNPLFPPIVRGIEDVLAPAGYNGLIVNTDNDEERERHQVESLRSREVDGLIVATARLEHALVEQLHREGVPMVMVNRRPHRVDVSSVTVDDTLGISMAVEHLVGLGHTRILHIAGPATTSTGVTRARAFRNATDEQGLDAEDCAIRVCERWAEEDGANAVRQALDEGLAFSAVIAGNDLIALGCYDVLAERGLSCPRDLSIVGFNNMPFLDKMSPPLTTVAIPQHQIGAEAARLLLEELSLGKGPRLARSVLLAPTLAVRGSTAERAAEAL